MKNFNHNRMWTYRNTAYMYASFGWMKWCFYRVLNGTSHHIFWCFLCWQPQNPVRLQHCRRNKMQSITCADSTCPHISSHIFICYLFPRLPWTCCQTFIKFHMFSPFCCILALQGVGSCNAWNFLAVVISLEPLLTGTRARGSEVIWSVHAHIYTFTHARSWQPGQEWGTVAVISDISPDSRYPNLCTWLGAAYHCGPFRHTRLDRWMEWRETEGEPVSLDALPERRERKEGGGRGNRGGGEAES